MEDVEDEYMFPRSILQYAKDTILAPFRIATSPTLLRAYLRTALLLLASTILFAVAVIAYTSFYYTYIPVRGISVPIYLQYDHTAAALAPHPVPARGKFPFGNAAVRGLASRQKYDVVVDLEMPRSAPNLAAGNWMVGVELRAPGTAGGGLRGALGWEEEWSVEDYSVGGEAGEKTATERAGAVEKPVVLARSRRPAILTYRSWMTEVAYRALRLPLYVAGFGHESEKVEVRMMEGVEFERGWRNVPSEVRLEVRSRTPLEVYCVGVRFVARLEGLRWLMYTHRLASFVFFTGLFWAVEMGVVLLSWALFSVCFGGVAEEAGEEEERRKIKVETGTATPKTEPMDSEPPTPLSDTSRTFPTLSSQQPLHYSAPAGKESKVKAERQTPRLDDIPSRIEGEADDEDDESADFVLEESMPVAVTDSGIGTSLASSADRSHGLSRRRSGKKERRDGGD